MSFLDPSLTRMLGLTSSTRTENRENMSTAELEVRVALKRNRALLERKMYWGAGFLGGFAVPKFLLR